MGKTVSIIAIVIGLILIAVAGSGLVAMRFLDQPASRSTDVVVFEVRPGDSFRVVAQRLESVGLVSNATWLQWYTRFTGQASKVKVGEYALRHDLRPREIMAVLVSGKSIEYPITIQEGLNRFEIAELVGKQGIISQQDFLQQTSDPGFVREMLGESQLTLEGYLFPETYHITKFTTVKALVRTMVNRFKESIAKVGPLPPLPGGRLMTRHELVTLASIIEKETGAPEERPMISSVFHNRLRLGMKLQTDPTVVYGIWNATGRWNRNISRADLLAPTPYNTYVIGALPPGPIANPGAASLQAAASPSQGEFLFFVSRNDGTHIFSKDYAGHQRAVSKFQLDRRAREGKSWRDLKNRAAVPGNAVGR